MLLNLPNTEVLDVWADPCAHSPNLIIEFCTLYCKCVCMCVLCELYDCFKKDY